MADNFLTFLQFQCPWAPSKRVSELFSGFTGPQVQQGVSWASVFRVCDKMISCGVEHATSKQWNYFYLSFFDLIESKPPAMLQCFSATLAPHLFAQSNLYVEPRHKQVKVKIIWWKHFRLKCVSKKLIQRERQTKYNLMSFKCFIKIIVLKCAWEYI